MTKTNEKIHVLADESLGGIKREYVEVDRKAKVGDLIVITASNYEEREEIYVAGHYGKVIAESEFSVNEFEADFNGFDNSFVGDEGLWYVGGSDHGEYNVLEPTNVVHIDGERYEMVDRPPEIGGKVLRPSDGFFAEVVDFDVHYVHVPGARVYASDICVLVPVESSEEEPQPSDPIDVIANLATRVAELERKDAAKDDLINKALSDVYIRIGRLQDEIDTLHKDIRTIGEELEALKYAAKETDGKVAHLEADIEESFPATDAPLVFICRKPGRFEVYQDGKKLHGVMSVRINAKVGEFATHEIEYISGATEEERQ